MSRSRRGPDTIEFRCQECRACCTIHQHTGLELGHSDGCTERPECLSGQSGEEGVA